MDDGARSPCPVEHRGTPPPPLEFIRRVNFARHVHPSSFQDEGHVPLQC